MSQDSYIFCCVTRFVYFLHLLYVRCNCQVSSLYDMVTNFSEDGPFCHPLSTHEQSKKLILSRVNYNRHINDKTNIYCIFSLTFTLYNKIKLKFELFSNMQLYRLTFTKTVLDQSQYNFTQTSELPLFNSIYIFLKIGEIYKTF